MIIISKTAFHLKRHKFAFFPSKTRSLGLTFLEIKHIHTIFELVTHVKELQYVTTVL